MVFYLIIMYLIFYITANGRDPFHDIQGEKIGPYILCHSWQGGMQYTIS